MAPKNAASLAAIRGQKEGLPDWWRIGHDFPTIVRGYRADRWELTAPSSWAVISDKDIPYSESFPARYRIG